MAETVTSLFGGHRQPADRRPASWPTVQPAACLQSFGYATLTSSAPSCSTGPARRDTDDSLTSYLRRCRHSYRLRHRRIRPFNFRHRTLKANVAKQQVPAGDIDNDFKHNTA